jgi:hypothetical protein
MNRHEFSNLIKESSKSEKELLKDFIIKEATNEPQASNITQNATGIEARAKDLKLDQIVEITQELSDGSIKKFKFKIIEIWPAPTNFFTVVSLEKPKDELNYWTLFYDNTWYIKKSNKSLINVHVRLI